MALKKEYSDQYINGLMKKLANGTLTGEERYILEKLAVDDPFLFEALQGYEGSYGSVNEKHLDSLREKIRGRKSRRILLYKYWIPAAAASLLLLFAVSSIIRTDSSKANESEPSEQLFAQREESKKDAATELMESEDMAESSNPIENDNDLSIATSLSKEKKQAQNQTVPAPQITTPIRSAPMDQKSEEIPDPPAKKEILADQSVQESMPASNRAEPEREESLNVNEENADNFLDQAGGATMNRQRAKAIPVIVDGVVKDENDEPLIGVNVLSKNSAIGTVTDIEGRFKLTLPSPNEELTFSYTGYKQALYPVTGPETIELTLSEDAASLSEVVVTGYSSRGKAEPKEGFALFNKYVEDNINRPSSIQAGNISGKVMVEFEVAEDGTPENFKIIRPLCGLCDQEAIRLIREGGKWKTEPDSTRVRTRYSVEFKLD